LPGQSRQKGGANVTLCHRTAVDQHFGPSVETGPDVLQIVSPGCQPGLIDGRSAQLKRARVTVGEDVDRADGSASRHGLCHGRQPLAGSGQPHAFDAGTQPCEQARSILNIGVQEKNFSTPIPRGNT
jgi:hypothetical protein